MLQFNSSPELASGSSDTGVEAIRQDKWVADVVVVMSSEAGYMSRVEVLRGGR